MPLQYLRPTGGCHQCIWPCFWHLQWLNHIFLWMRHQMRCSLGGLLSTCICPIGWWTGYNHSFLQSVGRCGNHLLHHMSSSSHGWVQHGPGEMVMVCGVFHGKHVYWGPENLQFFGLLNFFLCKQPYGGTIPLAHYLVLVLGLPAVHLYQGLFWLIPASGWVHGMEYGGLQVLHWCRS